MIDETHDPGRTSWVESANGHKAFPIQNLPHGVFNPEGGAARGGIAIGEKIFDISAALEVGLFSGLALEAAQSASGRSLNAWMESTSVARRALRRRVGELLDKNGIESGSLQGIAHRLLHDAARCTMHLPARVGDFTDFFAGIHHAYTAGTISRPENPLMPNYKYLPVAYHSRASSVRPSGARCAAPTGNANRRINQHPISVRVAASTTNLNWAFGWDQAMNSAHRSRLPKHPATLRDFAC
jgi:fumarylacetoacetase